VILLNNHHGDLETFPVTLNSASFFILLNTIATHDGSEEEEAKMLLAKCRDQKKEFQIQQRAFLPPFLPCFLSLRRIAPRVISVSNLAKKRQQRRSAHTWGGTCCCHAIVVEV
jgi:hypothetical protein